jgi:2-phosphosulfolactate phosphatase
VAVVLDVLRATTTIVHALAAGCPSVRPCATLDEARALARSLPPPVLLAGERDGRPIPGFDRGNTPGEYTPDTCRNSVLVLTTTNGTRALLHALPADRVLAAGLVNFSATCEQLAAETRPVHVLCAGDHGAAALEDTFLAGALVDFLQRTGNVSLDDGALISRACFASSVDSSTSLADVLGQGHGGALLRSLGYDEDIRAAASVDRFALVAEVRRDPLRVEGAPVTTAGRHWPTT